MFDGFDVSLVFVSTWCLSPLVSSDVVSSCLDRYEPIGIVAGVALGELPALWKLLHEHGDMIDKELDAVIMVQAVRCGGVVVLTR